MSTNPFNDPGTPGNPYSAGTAYPTGSPPAPASPMLAIVSLVCGILSIFPGCCCGLIGIPLALAALITGGMVMANPNAGGRPMAIGGVVTGGLALLLMVGLLVLSFANPELANEWQKQMQQIQMQQEENMKMPPAEQIQPAPENP